MSGNLWWNSNSKGGKVNPAWKRKTGAGKIAFPLLLTLSFGVWLEAGRSQILPDATLPDPSRVTVEGSTLRIEGGTASGGNLFHSFSEFSILTGETAFFNNSLDVENILTRVTGANPSNIDGIVRANGTANLFLLNPQGIVFGANARLEIGGAFVSTTADRYTFGDRGTYSAIAPDAPPLLTVKVPIGLQFGANPGSIQVLGSGHDIGFSRENGVLQRSDRSDGLQVQPGQTIALLGGDLQLNGGIIGANSGRIELRSLSNGELSLVSTAEGLSVEGGELATLGTIQLSNTALLDASGDRGGAIRVWAGRVRLQDGATIVALTQGGQPGKAIVVNASEAIELFGRTPDGSFPTSFVTWTNGAAAGGDLSVSSDRVRLQDGAALATGTDGAGNSGALHIRANSVELGGLSANGARLTGILSNSGIPATGVGGNVTIDTQRLSVENGAVISVSTFQAGKGGNLTVRADEIAIAGTSADGNVSSGFYARATTDTATGNAGNVQIEAETMSLRDRGRIDVANKGTGDAGNFTVQTETLELENRSVITATTREGAKGNIIVNARDVRLLDGSEIVTNSGNADGGNIAIAAETLTALNNSDITANASAGRGGRVTIATQGIFGTQFRDRQTSQSDITATSDLGAEFSGIVEIKTPDVEPASGLVELPQNAIGSNAAIATGCLADAGNEFTITGRGGLPEDPTQILTGGTIWRDLRLGIAALAAEELHVETRSISSGEALQGRHPGANRSDLSLTSHPDAINGIFTRTPHEGEATLPLIEATGWRRNADGEMELVAIAAHHTPHPFWNPEESCHVR